MSVGLLRRLGLPRSAGFAAPPPDRRTFVPEVVQTSEMDCGPAALKALLEGYGVSASYGRLREACQTDVDGTSIDTLEDVAIQLGFAAEQVMVPPDHLLLPEAQCLPAIVVVRLPNGFTHFVVVWNQVGPLVQLMDPATGRRWLRPASLLNELYRHRFAVPAAAWRDWAASDDFRLPLRVRLVRVLTPPAAEPAEVTTAGLAADALLAAALDDEGWHSLARLDAAVRMVAALVDADALRPGDEARAVVQQVYMGDDPGAIPAEYWSVQPGDTPDDGTGDDNADSDAGDAGDDEMLYLHGAVLVRILGRDLPDDPAAAADDAHADDPAAAPRRLPPELVAALEEPPTRPLWEVVRLLRADGLLSPLLVTVALLLGGLAVLVEALILRGLLDIGLAMETSGQRLAALAVALLFFFGLLLLEFPLLSTSLRVARRFETRLRTAFLAKIPRLNDRYFQSRLISDMAQRIHSLRQLRTLPTLAVDGMRVLFQIVFTTLGIIWLDPWNAPLALLAAFAVVAIPFATQPLMAEHDMRLRSHLGALSRFALDALLGLVPIRTHGAERAMRREHEALLVEWVRAGDAFYRVELLTRGVELLVGWLCAVAILFSYIARGGEASGVLLLFYWVLNLPLLGRNLLTIAQQYPIQRNRLLRLLEPLNALEDRPAPGDLAAAARAASDAPAPARGVAVSLENVSVTASGHPILHDISVEIAPGEHVAIVGPSGAGKSSLVGLLLGWYQPAAGTLRVDGQPLTGAVQQQLRQATAWVDPAVQLWNRSLLANVRYGAEANGGGHENDLPIVQANLFGVLEKLPDGLQTPLGEGGGMVSGGEGQRVRLARALYRPGVRLVILDEPFRGLDRGQRRDLLHRARQHWHDATVLFISHDVGDTQAFDRVLVVEGGQVAEDAAPATLAAQPDSRYRALLDAEHAVREGLWADAVWRRCRLEGGRLHEEPVTEQT